MNKLKISNVTITKESGKITYFLPEKMTGTKLVEFKARNKEEINNFLKK
jgi:hypothetical protein